MKIELVPLKKIKPNPSNPRIIKDDKFEKLVRSLATFPEMLEKRPLVCVTDTDGKCYPLGGNMRLKAIPEAIKLLKEDSDVSTQNKLKILSRGVPVQFADDWSEDQRRQFIIKDNVGFGEWDYEMLVTDFEMVELKEWGLDIPDVDSGPGEKEESAPKWFLNIEFDNEVDTQKWYDTLSMKGLKIKIVQ